jgi:two-component system, chemotaxis family, chemotaxis protein CheY
MTTDCFILIVDDDADVRESIREALEAEGYRVAAASNGKEALRLLKDDNIRPDLILLDIMMPEMDGWAFRAEQRKDPELASIPVLVFTAYGSPKDVAQQLQAVGFLRKPLRLDDLLSAIDRVGRGSVGAP